MIVGEVAAGQVPAATGENPAAGVDPADANAPGAPPAAGEQQSQLAGGTLAGSSRCTRSMRWLLGDAAEHDAEGLSDSMQCAAAAPAAQEATPVVRDASTRQRKTLWVEEVKAAHNLQQVWLGYWWLGYCLGYWLGHWLWYWVGYYWLGCWLGYCL